MSDAKAFESALRANPDDLAGWCAYADYLAERGDPRGEFMQVQIALEDEDLPKEEREELKKKEKELFEKHEREWLGGLAQFVLDAEPIYRDIHRMETRFTRGWLNGLICRSFSVNEARALSRTPGAALLNRLLIASAAYEGPKGSHERIDDSYYEPGPDVPEGIDEYEAPSLYALAHAPQLTGVRVFRFGDGPTTPNEDDGDYGQCHANGEPVHEVIARMPLLEELYLYAHDVRGDSIFALPLPRLRVLRVEHGRHYPLNVLAANPTLGNLTHLLCHPHAQRPDDPRAYISLDHLRAVCCSPHLTGLRHLQLRLTEFGDVGVEVVIGSGILKRLKVLDLSYGCITDEGAKRLAARRELRNLERLDLTMNAMTEEGITALAATGVALTADRQHGEHPDHMDEYGYLDYLGYGDME